jgi:hypothetical protein
MREIQSGQNAAVRRKEAIVARLARTRLIAGGMGVVAGSIATTGPRFAASVRRREARSSTTPLVQLEHHLVPCPCVVGVMPEHGEPIQREVVRYGAPEDCNVKGPV